MIGGSDGNFGLEGKKLLAVKGILYAVVVLELATVFYFAAKATQIATTCGCV